MVQRILAPTDFSDSSRRAIDFARQNFPRAEVRILHAIDDPAISLASSLAATGLDATAFDKSALEEEYERWAREEVRSLGDGTIKYGRPADVIIGEADAWGADLIVMGTHGRRGIARVFAGSVAEEVIRRANAPVLTARVVHARLPEEEWATLGEAVEQTSPATPQLAADRTG
jgi:nucleotide-binding universal stress UspA family protein